MARPETRPPMTSPSASDVALEPRSPGVWGWALTQAPVWIGGLSMIGIFVVWAQEDGGFDATVWMPGALFTLGLLAAVVVGTRGLVRLERAPMLAVLAFAAFTAWSFASILWADVRGDAWTGANRTLLYGSIFLLLVLLPWTPKPAEAALWLFSGGVTVVAALAVVRVATVQDDSLFLDGRLSPPTGYPNANVALFMGAFWVALALATRREQPLAARALALGSVVFLSQAAFIVQSRAAVVAVPLTAIAVLAVAPGRLRTLLGLAIAAVPLAVGWETHVRVYEFAEDGGAFLEDVMQPSARFMLVTSVAALVVGFVWGLADRRVELSPRTIRAASAVVATAAVVGVVVAGFIVARASPIDKVEVAWTEFISNKSDYEGASRFGSLDSERWDHWRVALSRFRDRPVTGIGAEQFSVDYLQDRRTLVDSRYAHSLEIGILSQLGIAGAVLFGAFVVLALRFTWPRRVHDPVAGTVRFASFGLLVYWLLHASVDWFYEIPAVTAPVFAFVAISAALGGGPRPSRATLREAALATAGIALVAACVVSVGAQYLAARELDGALAVWARDPEAAYERLDRARSLDPLADEPDLYAGAIAARLGDRSRMRLHFARALERNPHNWYAHLELGLARSVGGDRQGALREVRRARALNPRDPIVAEVLERLQRGERVSPRSVDPLFLESVGELLR